MTPVAGQFWRWDGAVYRVKRVSVEWADVQPAAGGRARRVPLPFPEGAEQVVRAFGEWTTQPTLDLEGVSAWR